MTHEDYVAEAQALIGPGETVEAAGVFGLQDDYKQISKIWGGTHPEDGSPLRVVDGPPEGFAPPELDEEPQLTAPMGGDIDPAMFQEVAARLFGKR